MTEQEQPLPAAVDTERALLGSILMNGELFAQAQDLEKEAFTLDSHRRIFQAMAALADLDSPIDFVTVTQWLQVHRWVEAVGGIAYLASLTESLPRRAHLAEYVRIVKAKASLRRIIALAERARTRAYDNDDPAEVLAEAQAEWDELAGEAQQQGPLRVGEWFARNYPDEEQYFARNAKAIGIPSGLRALDELTCGLQPDNLILLAGRPGMGKTACGANIASHVAVELRKTVAFFSLEMPTQALLDRMACARGNVSLSEQRTGTLSPVMDRYFRDGLADHLNEAMLFVDETPALSAAQIQARALRLRQQVGELHLVVVDYLGLMAAGKAASKNENREQQVAGNSRALKALAKRLHVPVLVLTALGREVTKRSDHRPILSDLRESGALEQDADLVVFVHREEYYSKEPEVARRAELIVAKQRQGATGTANVWYDAASTKFCNTDPKGERLW
jgi:replicative DNA helicase